jgi:hypothetical protein
MVAELSVALVRFAPAPQYDIHHVAVTQVWQRTRFSSSVDVRHY